jgi:hypothetical protein
MQNRWLPASVLTTLSLLPISRPAPGESFSNAIQQVSQCVLNTTMNTHSNAAVAMIQTACNDLYNHVGLPASDSKLSYNHCLLQHLGGAQSDDAAVQIKTACANLYSPL